MEPTVTLLLLGLRFLFHPPWNGHVVESFQPHRRRSSCVGTAIIGRHPKHDEEHAPLRHPRYTRCGSCTASPRDNLEYYSLGLRPFLKNNKPSPDHVSNLTRDLLSHGGGTWIRPAATKKGGVSSQAHHPSFKSLEMTGNVTLLQWENNNVSLLNPFNASIESHANHTTQSPWNATAVHTMAITNLNASTTPAGNGTHNKTSLVVEKPRVADYNLPWASYLLNLSMYQPSSSSNKKNVSSSGGAVADAPPTPPPVSIDFTKRKRTDLLTLEDLESILLTNKFVRESDLKKFAERQQQQQQKQPSGSGSLSTPNTFVDSPKRIAFPQPSTLQARTLWWGCAVSSGLMGMLLATSLIPNLWLMGLLAGSLYGYDVGKRDDEEAQVGPLPGVILYAGKRLALAYLQVFDFFNAVFFMWKTGQLSYEYYKTYATLDQRFAIQRKIDAWNAFFVEGKIAFDNWEKQNEVGRKILAGLRTAWLVEERSLKKSRRKRLSKYRVVQFVYDVEDFVWRFFRSMWKAVTGGGSNDLREFLKGISIDMSESRVDQIGSRIGSTVAAVLAVNLTGALFAISPLFLSAAAVLFGVAWPTWVPELAQRFARFVDETRARGRGDPAPSRSVDKSKYHFFVRVDGKRRYYRAGRPWFATSRDAGGSIAPTGNGGSFNLIEESITFSY